MGKGLERSGIDKLSLKTLKIALASGLKGELYKYALNRYLRMMEEREKSRT